MDDACIDTLGLTVDINWMLENVGWSEFARTRYPAYIGPTLEFLSSFNAQLLQGAHCTEGRIIFRLFNQDFLLTLTEFNEIFELPFGGNILIILDLVLTVFGLILLTLGVILILGRPSLRP